jgi:hypothetical protein
MLFPTGGGGFECSIYGSFECIINQKYDAPLVSGARRLTGRRRKFIGEVTRELCGGNPRLAERRFGWGRETAQKGLHEWDYQAHLVERFSRRGRKRGEEQAPELAAAIRAIAGPMRKPNELPVKADSERQAAAKNRAHGALFARLQAVRGALRDDQRWKFPWTRRPRSASANTLWGETRTDSNGQAPKGWDHDPPAQEKCQVPQDYVSL